ncbi:MAG: YraN family protein [Ruminococcaceae bacterium]|nr:YraN family protein [Oscillospiraceae bacterium]
MKEKLIGRFGEGAAADYLRKKRYRIIGMNYSCRFGEIDLIAETKDCVVFVEVKSRRDAHFAQAREFVTAAKQRRLTATAGLWLAQNPTDKQPRFDVVEVYCENGIVHSIQHIENAF